MSWLSDYLWATESDDDAADYSDPDYIAALDALDDAPESDGYSYYEDEPESDAYEPEPEPDYGGWSEPAHGGWSDDDDGVGIPNFLEWGWEATGERAIDALNEGARDLAQGGKDIIDNSVNQTTKQIPMTILAGGAALAILAVAAIVTIKVKI